MKNGTFFALFILFFSLFAHAGLYNWKENQPLPINGLPNPLNLTPSELTRANRAGRLHALNYPITVTGAALPYKPFKKLLQNSGIGIDGIGERLGLHPYSDEEGTGPYFAPHREGLDLKEERMGFTRLQTNKGEAITFSCAACHSTQLFGRPVIGLTNKFPRANEIFADGKSALNFLDSSYLRALTGASKEELALFLSTKENLRSVEAKKPQTLGLDTSLAHVALSLSRRKKDEWATKERSSYKNPRFDPLRKEVGDSKPAVWWNVKYKNKWLLDGSVVSGNPIFTNIIWNEIGRGTDLKELNQWLKQNSAIINELTTAVYQATPPPVTDFFPEHDFDISSARRGEKLFQQNCMQCHGSYEKGWSLANAESLSLRDQIRTVRVNYFANTPVVDVGTDPLRHQAMASLVQLNDLAISKENGILIREQKGYVPPPLEGIWARYPYLHNNSVASLCDLLTPSASRPRYYLARPAEKTDTDFDFECNGYPKKERYSLQDKNSRYFFDTTKTGLSNKGHDRMLLNSGGSEKFSPQDKKDLIHFLQTL